MNKMMNFIYNILKNYKSEQQRSISETSHTSRFENE